MRYDPDHKARTRAKVLAEAATLLRQGGPDRLGVAAVMARAGLTHGGFYAHFASRDDLLAGAVDYLFERPAAAFRAEADSPDPHDALQRFVARYLSMRHVGLRDAGCPIPILAGDLPRLPPAARASFVAGIDRLIDGVVTLLERADVPDARARARSAVAEMVGAITLARAAEPAAAAALLESSRASVEAKLGLQNA